MHQITIKSDGTGTVTVSGADHPITAHTYGAAQAEAIELLVTHAKETAEALTVTTNDPAAPILRVTPNGEVTETAPPSGPPAVATEPVDPTASSPVDPQPLDQQIQAHAAAPAPASTSVSDTVQTPALARNTASSAGSAATGNPFTTTTQTPQRAGSAEEATQTRRERRAERQSFLTQEQAEQPATQGWRGFLTSLGIRVSPSETEKAERNDRHAVSQHWAGPRTIAVVNGKGGAGKTPSTVLLSAVFARYGGGGVLAWDNNQTRGTLGWRTEQAGHESTILDLLPKAEGLLAPGAQSADLAHFVHHQTGDRYDVLRSKPMVLADEQRVNAGDVDAIHQVASKFYRLIFIDSGNDESDPLWKRMVDHADQIVVATTTKDEHAEAGALLLEALADRDERSAALADNAVVIVSQAEPGVKPEEAERVRTGFSSLARHAVTIPFDPAMVDGVLRFDALRPTTQRAWLGAAAAVAKGL